MGLLTHSEYTFIMLNMTGSTVVQYACVCQLIKFLGSWPVTSDAVSGIWSNASWDLETALNAARLYASFPFFATMIGVDDKNSSSYVITVGTRCFALCVLN